jgi:hypothetical protein
MLYSLTIYYSLSTIHCKFKKSNLLGAPEGIRTPDPLLRRQLLYPTELQAQIKNKNLFPEFIKTSLNKNYMSLEEIMSRIAGRSLNLCMI